MGLIYAHIIYRISILCKLRQPIFTTENWVEAKRKT